MTVIRTFFVFFTYLSLQWGTVADTRQRSTRGRCKVMVISKIIAEIRRRNLEKGDLKTKSLRREFSWESGAFGSTIAWNKGLGKKERKRKRSRGFIIIFREKKIQEINNNMAVGPSNDVMPQVDLLSAFPPKSREFSRPKLTFSRLENEPRISFRLVTGNVFCLKGYAVRARVSAVALIGGLLAWS